VNERDAGIKKLITTGDVESVRALIQSAPTIVSERLVGGTRTLLHMTCDWPGNFPNAAAMIRLLVSSGADVNARMVSPKHRETALHFAASCDDVDALDALLACGADIEADGAVIGGGSALFDAVAFGCWKCARRLVERGAKMTLWQAAALGRVDEVKRLVEGASSHDVTNAFWSACHGGCRATAEILLAHGADPNWIGHDGLTPMKAAARSKATLVVEWLASIGVPG
jgi:ankyrin repeat protein